MLNHVEKNIKYYCKTT